MTLDENILLRVYRDTVGKAVTDHSQLIYESLSVANTIDLYDKDTVEERKHYQTLAKREVTKLLASLRVLYSITKMDSDKMQYVLQKTVEVERMIKKWMESDQVRLGASLHVLRKDIVDTSIFRKNITANDIFAPRGQVNFDTLLKDAKDNSPTNFHLDPEKPRFIPPASTLVQPVRPIVNYVGKTDAERAQEVATSRSELDIPKQDVPMMERKTRADYAIPTKLVFQPESSRPEPEVVEVTVPKTPIVVPDDRIFPDKPKKEEANKPLSETVEISTEGLPLAITEDLEDTSTKEDKSDVQQEKGVADPQPEADSSADGNGDMPSYAEAGSGSADQVRDEAAPVQ